METMHDERCLDLAGVDWDAAWHEDFARRSKPDNVEKWNRRAMNYAHRRIGRYEQEFLSLLDIRPGDSVLDFGCGPGVLVVPLAQLSCEVVAADFSEGMLAEARARVEEAGVADKVRFVHVAWDDDWDAAGIAPDSVDVAVASRSISTSNMAAALRKLDRSARRQVAVSLAAGHSPRRDERAYGAIGRSRLWVGDYAYCMNILFERGVYPELSYIVTHSNPAFTDRTEAFAELAHMLEADGGPLDERERAALDAFLDEHYAYDPEGEPGRQFAADTQRDLRWACISWRAGQGD